MAQMASKKEMKEMMRRIEAERKHDKNKAVELFYEFIRKFPQKVKVIVLHYGWHIEELGAYVILKKFSKKFFPGIENAIVEIWGEGKMLADYTSKGITDLDLLVNEGVLIVGTANSLIDEHGTKFLSATSLVVWLLGRQGDPLFTKILKFYDRVDSSPSSMFFDDHSRVKRMHLYNRHISGGLEDVEQEESAQFFNSVVKWVEADLWDQLRFLECKAEFKKTGEIFKSNDLGIAAVESDNHAMGRWVRSVHKEVDITIQHGSNSSLIFFESDAIEKLKKDGVTMKDIRRFLRLVELRQIRNLAWDNIKGYWVLMTNDGREVRTFTWQELEADGPCDFCPQWHCDSIKGNALQSCGHSAPDSDKTFCDLKAIVGAVSIALFPIHHPCVKKECEGKSCDKYKLGAIFCRTKRFEEKQAATDEG